MNNQAKSAYSLVLLSSICAFLAWAGAPSRSDAASGLIFIAGTLECFLRAFDIVSGKESWKGQLGVCGNATPMTYRVSATGRQ